MQSSWSLTSQAFNKAILSKVLRSFRNRSTPTLFKYLPLKFNMNSEYDFDLSSDRLKVSDIDR